MQGWGAEHKAKLEIEAKKSEKKVEAETAKKIEKKLDEKAEQDRNQLRKTAKERFDHLGSTEQAGLINEFGSTLKGFPLTTFKKTGVSSAMLAPTFATWLITRLSVTN